MPPDQFSDIGNELFVSTTSAWETFMAFLPTLLSALLIILLGLIIAPILGMIAAKILRLFRLDALSHQSGFQQTLTRLDMHTTPSRIVGSIVKWFVLIAFLLAAVDILGWQEVTIFLRDILLYIPNIIIAVIILAIGFIVGNFLDRFIRGSVDATNLPVSNVPLLGTIARTAVVTFAVLAALLQLGIAESLIQIGVAGLVLALALAFGLGGRTKAAELLDRLDSRSSKRSDS